MAFGKLYTREGNSRSIPIKVVAKANNLDLIEIHVDADKPDTEYLKLNKLGKIPSFVGEDGYELTECIAIAIYVTSQNEKTSLLGKTKQDYASIVRWMSYCNQDLASSFLSAYRPLIGVVPYNKKAVTDALDFAMKATSVLEDHLLVHTFLVGERITLADIFCASLLGRSFQYFFDKKWRSENPNIVRWYETVFHQPIYAAVAGPNLNYIDEAVKNQPPAKPKAEEKSKAAKQEKAAPKPKAKEVDEDEEEEEDKPAPKPKHPLEALSKPTLVLDDWKRKYSNEDTRTVALPWFWENFKPEEYSLWKVDYKYNDELTMTFMTSNLIGGFFTRLEASRKYIFGCASVYGATNDSVVRGAFVIRGQDAEPAFDVAPDYESYKFTKLDPAKDREFVDDMWSWDKPIEVDGKSYGWADGKVFK